MYMSPVLGNIANNCDYISEKVSFVQAEKNHDPLSTKDTTIS